MNRILLIGSSGQVGRELQKTLPSLGNLIGVSRETLDLTQLDQIRQVIQEAQPDLIVNAAAYTAVDKAETETELANLINAAAPTVMAEEAQCLGTALIHISTDYVFDGTKNTPYTEDDLPNPIGLMANLSCLAKRESAEFTRIPLTSAMPSSEQLGCMAH